MKSIFLCLVISSFFTAYVLSEEHDEEMKAESVNELLETLDFVESDDLRSDEECIPRNHDCTNHRHRCCRSKYFKDNCKCFYVDGNSTDTEVEMCTCQQEWYKGMAENFFNKTSKAWAKVKKLFG